MKKFFKKRTLPKKSNNDFIFDKNRNILRKNIKQLTGHCKSADGYLFFGVADPFLAALAWNFHFHWVGALRTGKQKVIVTSGDAADLPILARTMIFATGLKRFTIAIHHVIEDALVSFHSLKGSKKKYV